MLFKSQIMTQASGSVGGLTASRNRFGNYFRGRALPVNPNTIAQQLSRANMAQFATGWAGLTLGQRNAWEAWAAVVTKTNKLGDQVLITGFNWYVAVNSQRAAAGILPVATPSGDLALTSLTPPSVTVHSVASVVAITFTDTDEWANEDNGFLLMSASLPQPPTKTFFKGPFFVITPAVLGDVATPPTSPANRTHPSILTNGQRVFFRFVAQSGDGKPSSPTITSSIVVT